MIILNVHAIDVAIIIFLSMKRRYTLMEIVIKIDEDAPTIIEANKE